MRYFQPGYQILQDELAAGSVFFASTEQLEALVSDYQAEMVICTGGAAFPTLESTVEPTPDNPAMRPQLQAGATLDVVLADDSELALILAMVGSGPFVVESFEPRVVVRRLPPSKPFGLLAIRVAAPSRSTAAGRDPP